MFLTLDLLRLQFLAISSYLEAKRIKNVYMIQDTDSDNDLDEEEFMKTMDFNK